VYPAWLVEAGFFCFGLIFGSFLNVCIYRLPRGLSVVRPRSACPGCGVPIAAYDNIPVLSWLLLRGRCRHCRTPITPRYALVELACGLLFLFSFLQAGSLLMAVKGCVLSILFLGLIFTDAETHLLPDAMTLPGLGAALVLSLFCMVPGPALRIFPLNFAHSYTALQLDLQLGWRSLFNALLGAAIGAGTLFGIGWVYFLLRKVEGMGMGDVKLMAMVGAFLGPSLTIFVLCSASLLGGTYGVLILLWVFRKRMARYRRPLGARASSRAWKAAQTAMHCTEIPFGVFLCAMSLVAWFQGMLLIRGYLRLF
jgi:leader peptidase (prepilin peptidase)/N-methyltransferase